MGTPSVKFSDLNVKVKVEDGSLLFETLEDLQKVIDFLGKATPTEISKWENSLVGFTSVSRNYLDARDLKNDIDIPDLKLRYNGKVIIKDDGTIEPFISNGIHFGRIINEKGIYKIGKTIVQYYNNRVISIPDGDERKLQIAINTLKQDTLNGIYIHPLILGEIPQNSSNNSVQTRSFCSDGCPINEDGNGIGFTKQGFDDANSSQYKMVGKSRIVDNSTVTLNPSSGCGYAFVFIHISVSNSITLEKWVKPFLKSWQWREITTGFAWGYGWDINMRINNFTGFYYPSAAGSPRNETGGWAWTVNGSGHLDVQIVLWNQLMCDGIYSDMVRAIADNGWTVCAKRTGLRAEASQADLSQIKIDTYCQK